MAGLTVACLMAAGAVEPCEIAPVGEVTLRIEGDAVVAARDGDVLNRIRLPVVGPGHGCRSAQVFADVGQVFLDWNEGRAGTSILFSRRSQCSNPAYPPGRGKPLRSSCR